MPQHHVGPGLRVAAAERRPRPVRDRQSRDGAVATGAAAGRMSVEPRAANRAAAAVRSSDHLSIGPPASDRATAPSPREFTWPPVANLDDAMVTIDAASPWADAGFEGGWTTSGATRVEAGEHAGTWEFPNDALSSLTADRPSRMGLPAWTRWAAAVLIWRRGRHRDRASPAPRRRRRDETHIGSRRCWRRKRRDAAVALAARRADARERRGVGRARRPWRRRRLVRAHRPAVTAWTRRRSRGRLEGLSRRR